MIHHPDTYATDDACDNFLARENGDQCVYRRRIIIDNVKFDYEVRGHKKGTMYVESVSTPGSDEDIYAILDDRVLDGIKELADDEFN